MFIKQEHNFMNDKFRKYIIDSRNQSIQKKIQVHENKKNIFLPISPFVIDKNIDVDIYSFHFVSFLSISTLLYYYYYGNR
jgi:hypothetical protein